MLSSVGAAPNTGRICVRRLGGIWGGKEDRRVQQLNIVKAAWCKMEGEKIPIRVRKRSERRNVVSLQDDYSEIL